MKWVKKGIIYSPSGMNVWDKYYGILPTPTLLNESVIRVYYASTDSDRNGYISFLDVKADDPSCIIARSAQPILSPGQQGSFDDSGCNPSCIVKRDDAVYLYYAGYQRMIKTPYTIFTGVAKSIDNGVTFQRVQQVPVLERTTDELTIRSAPTIIHVNGILNMWYVCATKWEKFEEGIFKGKMMPRYIIKKATSQDGINWMVTPGVAIDYQDHSEFGFGRPWVIFDGLYKMWYSVRRTDRTYRIGYAESVDGNSWVRRDDEVGIDVSSSGWDSEMICYPAVVKMKERTYLFYNGNNNGESGFGWAELMKA